jgi:hypothetical protein
MLVDTLTKEKYTGTLYTTVYVLQRKIVSKSATSEIIYSAYFTPGKKSGNDISASIFVIGRLLAPLGTEPVFLNIYGAQESIPRNEFRQPMYVAWRAGTITLFLLLA